jgi:hypothetical protein
MNNNLAIMYQNSQRELYTEVERLTAEVERVHQFLDECHIEGDGTEPLLERVVRAVNAAYVQGCRREDGQISVPDDATILPPKSHRLVTLTSAACRST